MFLFLMLHPGTLQYTVDKQRWQFSMLIFGFNDSWQRILVHVVLALAVLVLLWDCSLHAPTSANQVLAISIETSHIHSL